jgi:hypothetical protein
LVLAAGPNLQTLPYGPSAQFVNSLPGPARRSQVHLGEWIAAHILIVQN